MDFGPWMFNSSQPRMFSENKGKSEQKPAKVAQRGAESAMLLSRSAVARILRRYRTAAGRHSRSALFPR